MAAALISALPSLHSTLCECWLDIFLTWVMKAAAKRDLWNSSARFFFSPCKSFYIRSTPISWAVPYQQRVDETAAALLWRTLGSCFAVKEFLTTNFKDCYFWLLIYPDYFWLLQSSYFPKQRKDLLSLTGRLCFTPWKSASVALANHWRFGQKVFIQKSLCMKIVKMFLGVSQHYELRFRHRKSFCVTLWDVLASAKDWNRFESSVLEVFGIFFFFAKLNYIKSLSLRLAQ